MFKGHNFVKLINDDWVLDLTEFVGYKVKLDKSKNVISYKEAFRAQEIENGVEFDRYMKVPVKILKEATNQIIDYSKDFDYE